MASCYIKTPTFGGCSQNKKLKEKDEVLKRDQQLKSPQKSSSDEDEESVPDFSMASVGRRRVSFADAFGLDLVSVKEFDSRSGTGIGSLELISTEDKKEEEYYLSCIFNIPDSDDMLKLRIRQNKLELESIELLPGSTTIRGTVRVLNLSYHKYIYVRVTLDGWQSHFDLLADYVPGSSDGETDRFTFQLTLLAPFLTNAVRVEFCLCYETACGTFWANNGGMNYVMFCQHKRGALNEKDGVKERETEENNNKRKKTSLKVTRKWNCADLKPMGMRSELSEPVSLISKKSEEVNPCHKEESQSRGALERCKTLDEKCDRQLATQLADIQDFSQRENKDQLGHPTHSKRKENRAKLVLPEPQISNPVKIGNTSPVLSGHQTPLLSVKCGKHRSCSHSHTSKSHDLSSSEVPKKNITEYETTEPSSNAWETFLNETDSLKNHIHILEQECLLCPADFNARDKLLCRENTDTLECPLNRGNGSPEGLISEKTPQSVPAYKRMKVFDSSHARMILDDDYNKKTELSFQMHNNNESESVWALQRSEWSSFSESPHDRQATRDIAVTVDNTEPHNSKSVAVALLEECAGILACLNTEEKVKEETQLALNDTLTFTGIRNKPLADRHRQKKGSSEKENTDERRELELMNENIRKTYENATQINREATWRDYVEVATVVLESGRHGKEKDSSNLKEQNTEILNLGVSIGCDEGNSHKRGEWLDRSTIRSQEKLEATSCEPLKNKHSELRKQKRNEVAPEFIDKNIGNRECEKAELRSQEVSWLEAVVKYGKDTKGHDYIDKESYKLQSFPDSSPQTLTRFITNHNSEPIGHFSWTESEGENFLHLAPHESFENEKTQIAQDLQGLGVETEISYSLSTTNDPSASAMYSWLLVLWVKFCSLNHVFEALGYTSLFLILITMYLHDLPVCLAIYLLYVCWWCRQDTKIHVTADNSVD